MEGSDGTDASIVDTNAAVTAIRELNFPIALNDAMQEDVDAIRKAEIKKLNKPVVVTQRTVARGRNPFDDAPPERELERG